jgi:alkaline phosphatase
MRSRVAAACSVLTVLLALSCTRPTRPQAVILMIGDGMGVSQVSFARYLRFGASDGHFAFEGLPELGLVTTWSTSNAVTDSGAASTAFSAGVKTDNRVVGLGPDGRSTRTLADLAQAKGWRVGYVTTTRITHATPAAFYAHHENRDDECAIAEQLLVQRPDVALGGGLTFFDPDSPDCRGVRPGGRDLLAEARSAGYTVWQRYEAAPQPLPDRLLGLQARGHLAMQLDERQIPADRRDPALARLSELALEALSRREQPFFLLIEGGRIDHGGHAFDAASVAAEIDAFDEAVAAVLAFQRRNPETLVVVTADHATGGLAVNEFVDWAGIKRQRASVEWMTAQIRDAEPSLEDLASWTGFADWRAEELQSVRAASGSYAARRALGRALAERNGVTFVPRVDDAEVATHGHTGEDVAIYAGGPGSERFRGRLDNTDIARRLAEVADLGALGPPD